MCRLLALLVVAGVTACASVPLSTIVRMSTFDERDFAALDPGALRVRIRLPEPYALNTARSWLGVDLTSEAGTHQGTFELASESTEPAAIPGGLLSPDPPGIAYTLRLTDASRERFAALQGFVRRAKPDQINIRVVPIMSAIPTDAAFVRVWIELLLSRSQGYFTLVDGAQVPLDRIRAASTGS